MYRKVIDYTQGVVEVIFALDVSVTYSIDRRLRILTVLTIRAPNHGFLKLFCFS